MKTCIGCGCALTQEVRSKHQPTIRCLKCFAEFAGKVNAFFKGAIDRLEAKEKVQTPSEPAECPECHGLCGDRAGLCRTCGGEGMVEKLEGGRA